MKKNNKKGFTIVELVIVIAVIAILSAVLIPTFGGIIADANATAGKQEARNGYLGCYATDIKDGDVDGSGVTDTNYNNTEIKNGETGVWAYTVEKAGVKYSFDGTYFYVAGVKQVDTDAE